MKLSEVLPRMPQPVGLTSMIAASLPGGDPRSVSATGNIDQLVAALGSGTAVRTLLDSACAHLKALRGHQSAARSDAAWWGYEGSIAQWHAITDVLAAAVITGPDDLPDVPLPDLAGPVVLMDACANLQRFGAEILARASASRPT